MRELVIMSKSVVINSLSKSFVNLNNFHSIFGRNRHIGTDFEIIHFLICVQVCLERKFPQILSKYFTSRNKLNKSKDGRTGVRSWEQNESKSLMIYNNNNLIFLKFD